MHERGSEQDAGAEMTNGKEEGLGDANKGELGGKHGHGAGQTRDGEDDEQRADVEWQVVIACANDVAGAGIFARDKTTEGGLGCTGSVLGHRDEGTCSGN